MRIPAAAMVLLLAGATAARADDVPQPPATAGAPVKIIDATTPVPAEPAPAPAAPAAKADQAPILPVAPTGASTQDKRPARAAGEMGNRFSFVRVDDGFLRFDLQTGQVAYCNAHSDGWSCQAVPENRSALEREVQSLKDEVASLKHQIELLREPPPPPRPPSPIPNPPPPSPPAQGDITRELPSRDDVARAKAALQGVWQRFVDAIVGFKNDVMRKS